MQQKGRHRRSCTGSAESFDDVADSHGGRRVTASTSATGKTFPNIGSGVARLGGCSRTVGWYVNVQGIFRLRCVFYHGSIVSGNIVIGQVSPTRSYGSISFPSTGVLCWMRQCRFMMHVYRKSREHEALGLPEALNQRRCSSTAAAGLRHGLGRTRCL